MSWLDHNPLVRSGAFDASSLENDAIPKRHKRHGLDSYALILQSWRIMPETLSQRLAGVVLPDALGKTIRLGSLWENNPAVLVFLRHYG
jgi:hypothetical protein